MYLEKINQIGDIKMLSQQELPLLAKEIRSFLIESLSETGGHLGSNLGVVELTMALHRFLNIPEDKLILDVGHQCYTHKILTGRKDGFSNLRQYGGLSGFPKKNESIADIFETGHASNSISAGLGLVRARDLAGDTYKVVSLIGDGALGGGEAYEALNNASRIDSNFIIILNDNEMSISESKGGINRHLSNLRTAQGYLNLRDNIYNSLNQNRQNRMISGIRRAKNTLKSLFVSGMLFENLGLTYLGPVDGHNFEQLSDALEAASRVRKAVVLHVITKKGKGYLPAENHPARFHGTAPFHIENGVPLKRSKAAYQDVFSTVMCKQGERDDRVVCITAAMEDGTGLKRFHNKFPDRFFDVGIAEQHAVTFSAGLALGGYKPVFAVYSTFLQRAYDQVIDDVCMQDLPVVFAVDRAGIVGPDGETHQGIFDLSYLCTIPGLCVMAPKNKWELSDMIKFALAYAHPCAIRYPRGEAWDGLEDKREEIVLGKAEVVYEEDNPSDGTDVCLFAIGAMVKTAKEVYDKLKENEVTCSLVNARFAAPLDEECIIRLASSHKLFVTLEENVADGGFGERVAAVLAANNAYPQLIQVAVPKRFIPHGTPDRLRESLGIDATGVFNKIMKQLGR